MACKAKQQEAKTENPKFKINSVSMRQAFGDQLADIFEGKKPTTAPPQAHPDCESSDNGIEYYGTVCGALSIFDSVSSLVKMIQTQLSVGVDGDRLNRVRNLLLELQNQIDDGQTMIDTALEN